jgi:Mg2+/Co2+ transporter CorB
MLVDCILFFIFLMLMSFFSATETALTYSSKPKLHQMSKSGDLKAAIILKLHNKLGLVIGVILTCATLLSAIVVATGSKILSHFNNPFLDTFAPIMVGTIILIYAEVMPKMLILQNPTSFLLKISKVLNFLFKLFHPFNLIIQHISRFTLRIFGFKIQEKSITQDKDELRGVIDLHSAPDQDTVQEKAMLKSILDLGSVQVNEIMVHRQNVFTVNANLSNAEIIQQVLASPFTRIPLWKDNPDNIVGILHTKALLRVKQNIQDDQLDILSICHQPWFIHENRDLLEQLQAFREKREHFAIVVDEYGTLMGIVTLEDILEEIVGDIMDEHDVLTGGIRPQEDGSYLIFGNMTIRDVNRQLDLSLPDDQASTIAGLLLYKFRMIPKVGQVFHLDGVLFEILRKQNNQVTLVRMKKSPRVQTSES